jgi:hypothetical protein
MQLIPDFPLLQIILNTDYNIIIVGKKLTLKCDDHHIYTLAIYLPLALTLLLLQTATMYHNSGTQRHAPSIAEPDFWKD